MELSEHPPGAGGGAVVACADLAERAGARGFEIGYLRDDSANPGWYAVAKYRGTRLIVDEQPTPAAAAIGLAVRILEGGTCRCGLPVTLAPPEVPAVARSGGPVCRWQLVGPRWEPGCTAPPLLLGAGERGDVAALRAAVAKRRRAP